MRRFALPVALISLLIAGSALAQTAAPPSGAAPPAAVPNSGGRLGVGISPMTEDLRAYFGAPADRGVLVNQVEPGSAAEHAGIEVGDVVVALDGDPITTPQSLVQAVVPRGGQAVTMTVVRHGETLELPATITGEPLTGSFELPSGGPGGPTFYFDPSDMERLGDVSRYFEELGLSSETEQELRERLEAVEHRLDELEQRVEQNE